MNASPDRVDVAVVDLRQEPSLEVLTPTEVSRVRRFSSDDAARRWAVGRSALRQVLAMHLGADPSELVLERGPKGKPRLAGHDLHFNKTDCGEVALVGVVRGREIGVDLEAHRTVLRDERIAARYFAPDERSRLARTKGPARTAAFFDIWTTKEAVLKCDGGGLGAIPMASFSAPPGGGPAAGRWWIAPLDYGDRWSAAVALAGTEPAEVVLAF